MLGPYTQTSYSLSSGLHSASDNSEFVYLLCMREVPRYLQSTLCKSPGTVRNTRFSGREEDEVVRLPGVPQFQFVQDNQVRWSSVPEIEIMSILAVQTHHSSTLPRAIPLRG